MSLCFVEESGAPCLTYCSRRLTLASRGFLWCRLSEGHLLTPGEGQRSPDWSIQQSRLLQSIISVAHTFTLPFLAWDDSSRSTTTKWKCAKRSTQLAWQISTHYTHLQCLPFDGQEGPGQNAYVLNLFLEGQLMSGEVRILRPLEDSYVGMQVCCWD